MLSANFDMRGFAILVFVFLCLGSHAQSHFKSLRYEEDYRYLLTDSSKTPYENFKLKKLGSAVFLSSGGELRYQLQHFENEDWGEIPDSYAAVYTRFLFHTDLSLGNMFRAFLQLNSTFANGRVTPDRSIDENRLDVHQAFVETRWIPSIVLRIGRQEFLYGSQRLIAVREGPNNRRSFDAAKVTYETEETTIDFFYSLPVQIHRNILDDAVKRDQQLWGVYSVINEIPFVKNADIYYMGLINDRAQFDAAAGKETRHSIGTRLWANEDHWEVDFEAVYQFGSIGGQTIQAGTASINAKHLFANVKKPVAIGLKSEFISGDRKRDDNTLNTFNPLFPKGAYFGLAALIGPANLVDVHPYMEMDLAENLTFGVDYDLFWRQQTADGIYGANGEPIYSAAASTAHFIGDQLGVNLEFRSGRHLTVTPEFTWFNAGPYLKEVSPGKDVFFTAITLQYKY